MVNFIPDPDLQQVLPPLLAHIPAAFSSPKPPPSLPPLLSPILRSRIEHLSFGNTPWLQLLTWGSADDGEKLYSHLLEQDYFFLQSPSSVVESARSSMKGFRRLDGDTIHLAVDVGEIGLRLKFMFVINDGNGEDDGWKLLDVRLLEDAEEEELSGVNQEENSWSSSVGEAEEAFRSESGLDAHEGDERTNRLRSLSQALGGESGNFMLSGSAPTSPTSQRQPAPQREQEEDDDDDYWAQYDDIDGDSSRGDETASHHSSSPTAASAPRDDEDYYSRYDEVQPSMDSEDPAARAPTPPPKEDSSATPMPLDNATASASANNSNAPRQAPTHVEASDASTRSTSSSPARSDHSTPLTVQTSNPHRSSSVIAKLERQAEMSVQAETAIKQHVATSMKSLFRLWRAAGLEREEFERAVTTEIDMLAMMEEDDGEFGS